MKKALKFLFSRVVIVSLSILVQFLFLLFVVLQLSSYAVYIYFGLQLVSLAVVLRVVEKQDNPSYKISWIIAILLFPIFGGTFYLVFGRKSISRKIKDRIKPFSYYQNGRQEDLGQKIMDDLAEKDPHLKRQSEYVSRVGFPVWKNTEAEYFPLGEDFFEKLVVELKKAEKFIFMEYFIIQEGKMWNPILEIMTEKANAGVDVRLLYDDLGSIKTLPNGYYKKIQAAGIKCHVFNPFKPRLTTMFNYRDHRKITVIDGDVGFCGGLNLADEYINAYDRFGHWKDTAVMLKGDAVWNLSMMFLQLWGQEGKDELELAAFAPSGKAYRNDGYIQPYGDSPLDHINIAENIYLQIIGNAKKYLYITTPYLIIDSEMINALTMAASSGVDVRIITPHIPDKWYVHAVTRSNYQVLRDAGIRIFEYTPGFIHAKMFVADDDIAVVGTANMDYRSFYLHFECGVSFYKSSIVAAVKDDIVKTMDISQEIGPNPDKEISFWRRMGRTFLKAFAPMM